MRLISVSKKRAQSLIEYALILAMVAVVAIAALQLLGDNIGTALRGASSTVGAGANNAGEKACEAMGDEFQWVPGANGNAGTCQFNANNQEEEAPNNPPAE